MKPLKYVISKKLNHGKYTVSIVSVDVRLAIGDNMKNVVMSVIDEIQDTINYKIWYELF